VTLKPVFNERISFSAVNQMTAAEANEFLFQLREVIGEVDWIKAGFRAFKDNDEKLRGIVEEYQ
jgi:hypothetical protein